MFINASNSKSVDALGTDEKLIAIGYIGYFKVVS